MKCRCSDRTTSVRETFGKIFRMHGMMGLRLRLRTLLLFLPAFALMISGLVYLCIIDSRPNPRQSTGWQLVATLLGKSEVKQLEFSPDGNTLASGHASGAINLWDLSNRKLRVTLHLTGPVDSMSFSPNGRLIAAASASNPIVKVWDVTTGETRQSLHHSASVSSIDFSPSGMTIATFQSDSVLLWSVDDWEVERALECAPTLGPYLKFAPDGQSLAVVRFGGPPGIAYSPNEAVILDANTGMTRAKITGDFFDEPAFSVNGTKLLTLTGAQSVSLWNTADGLQAFTLPDNHNLDGWLSNVVFAPGGSSIIGGMQVAESTGFTKLVSLFRRGDVYAAKGAVVAWNGETGKMRTIIEDPLPVTRICMNSEGSALATGHWDGTIRIWKLQTTSNQGSAER